MFLFRVGTSNEQCVSMLIPHFCILGKVENLKPPRLYLLKQLYEIAPLLMSDLRKTLYNNGILFDKKHFCQFEMQMFEAAINSYSI